MTDKSTKDSLTEDKLLDLAIHNKDVDKISSFLNRFNPIEVMGMADMEIRHSSILGWLMNPLENHGLGDKFLKAFLVEALSRDNDDTFKTEIDTFKLYQSNLMDANIYIEWNNIDIFVKLPTQRCAFIIENKWHSKEHSGQLGRYYELVEERYRDHKICGVFLTLHGDAPQLDKDKERYALIQYSHIVNIIKRILTIQQDNLSLKIYNFIKYYEDILKRKCNMSDEQIELEQLAKKIYREHKDVIEFIYKNGKKTEFENTYRQEFKLETSLSEFTISETKFIALGLEKTIVSFLPKSWIKAMGELKFDEKKNYKLCNEGKEYLWQGCESYYWCFPVIAALEIRSGEKMRFFVELGPLKPHERRKEIIEGIKGVFEEKNLGKSVFGFDKDAFEENARQSRFINNIVSVDDMQDNEKIGGAIRQLMENVDFQEVIKPIANVLREVRQGLENSSQ